MALRKPSEASSAEAFVAGAPATTQTTGSVTPAEAGPARTSGWRISGALASQRRYSCRPGLGRSPSISASLGPARSHSSSAVARPEAPAAAIEPSERALIKRLLEFPEEVREAAARRAPHRICAYSTAVAADFHAFYRDCQVLDAEGEGVERSRLALCLLTKRTIAASLDLLGISAPERM